MSVRHCQARENEEWSLGYLTTKALGYGVALQLIVFHPRSEQIGELCL